MSTVKYLLDEHVNSCLGNTYMNVLKDFDKGELGEWPDV